MKSRAAELVDIHLQKIGIERNDIQQKARGMAARSELQYPINRKSNTIAAAAIYTTVILTGIKYTQEEIAGVTEVSTSAIRECYQEILNEDTKIPA